MQYWQQQSNCCKEQAISGKIQNVIKTVSDFATGFIIRQGPLQASALSFDTTLALVPLLALVFILLKMGGVLELLEPFILNQLSGSSAEVTDTIRVFAQKTELAGLASFGSLFLFFTLFMLLDKVRRVFNAIWNNSSPDKRSIIRRILDYMLVLILTPALLALALTFTSALQSQWIVCWLMEHTAFGPGLEMLFRLTPFLCSTLLLTLVYKLLPDVKIRLSSALLGGAVAGTLWQLTHGIYFHFQFGIARNNLIYGNLAIIPFLLVWIYTSWLIILAGFELTRCHQQGINCNKGLESVK
jgi:membrane protein